MFLHIFVDTSHILYKYYFAYNDISYIGGLGWLNWGNLQNMAKKFSLSFKNILFLDGCTLINPKYI